MKPGAVRPYPFGYFNDTVCRVAAEVFDAAFTCEEALNDPLVRIRMRAGLARRRLFRHLRDGIHLPQTNARVAGDT